MSMAIDLNGKQLAGAKEVQLQYLPTKVQGDGAANVDAYFNQYTRPEPDYGAGVLCNALRGYPLLGKISTVPNGYKGLVLQETSQPVDQTAERQLRMTGAFKEFTYWNYDKVPSNSDPYRQALQVLDVAEALAKPVTEDALEAEIKRRQEQMATKKENT